MAAVFGIVTGAFGACSLALELLEVTKSIQSCWRRLHDISSISRELSSSLLNIERLLMLISDLAIQESKDHYVFACLDRCRLSLGKVKNILEEIESGKSTKKLWKIKRGLRTLALEENLSVARVSLRETIDDLSLALLVLQSETIGQNSLVLSRIERSLSGLREEHLLENSVLHRCRDDKGSSSPTDFKGLNQHELYLNSSCNCQVQAEALSPRSSQLYTNQYDLSRSDCSLGKHTHHKVYHIRSQHLDLFLGVLSISILRKKNTRSDLNSRQQNSYTDIRLKFTPSFSFSRSFVARLYANTVAGLSVMQSLVTVQIVPRYEGIFLDVCGGDVTSAKRRLYNKEALPDSTDKYGHSLIAMAASNGHVEMVRLLLALGVNVQTVDDNGRNPLHYMYHHRNGPLSQIDWEIYRLLADKRHIDPWTPDFTGQNTWHTFCISDQLRIDFPWRSIAIEFRPIMDDQDHLGRTALFNMSSNAKANLDIFKWHLDNGASLSISANGHLPRWKGLTCLHAAIASLQPRYQQGKFNPLNLDCAEVLDYTSSDRKKQAPFYDEDDRVNQKKRIELLIQHGADLFVAAESYGTPTDLARFTGNYDLWIDCLKVCGIALKQFLTTDKKIRRSKSFWVTKRLAYEQKLERQKLRQHFNDIFSVLDDYISPEETNWIKPVGYRLPPIPVLPLYTNPYNQELHLFKRSLSEALYEEEEHQKPLFEEEEHQKLATPRLLVDIEIFHGAYHANFFNGHNYYYCGLIQIPVYKQLERYIETLAGFVSGEIDPEELKSKSNDKCLALFKAIAVFQLDRAFRFPPSGCNWRYEDDASEVKADIPGSWPSD